MEIEARKQELSVLIEMYLQSKISHEDLYEYSWETINFFSDHRDALPLYHENEKPFWYAIWQLQHLADEEHQQNGVLRKALFEINMYLKNQKKIAENYEGRRP